MEIGTLQQRIDTSRDLFQLVYNPVLEAIPFHRYVELDHAVGEMKYRGRLFGQLAFNFLYGLMQVITKVFSDQMKEGL